MIRSANLCERCDATTASPENEFGEFICDDCEQNAWDMTGGRRFHWPCSSR